MIIGVDAGCLGIKDDRLKVGVYYMVQSFFEELKYVDTQNTYLLYSFYPVEKKLLNGFGKNVKNVVVKPTRGWTKIWLPLRLLRDKPDIFVGFNQSLPLRLPLQNYKTIVVIHDVLFEEYPRLYPGSFRKLHRESKFAALLADSIIVPSKTTKRDIEKFYKISKEKITVIPEGIRKFSKVAFQQTGSNKPYFLFVGALKPQKNVPVLLKAFSKIKNKNMELVLVGGDKWRDKEIDKTFKKLPEVVKKKIKFLGMVSETQLGKLYKEAVAFVSSSYAEGFGLTFLEAMSYGTPVIGPKIGATPEVVGNAGILIDPRNTRDLQKAMESMLDKKTREKFSKKACLKSKNFSWNNFVESFLEKISELHPLP